MTSQQKHTLVNVLLWKVHHDYGLVVWTICFLCIAWGQELPVVRALYALNRMPVAVEVLRVLVLWGVGAALYRRWKRAAPHGSEPSVGDAPLESLLVSGVQMGAEQWSMVACSFVTWAFWSSGERWFFRLLWGAYPAGLLGDLIWLVLLVWTLCRYTLARDLRMGFAPAAHLAHMVQPPLCFELVVIPIVSMLIGAYLPVLRYLNPPLSGLGSLSNNPGLELPFLVTLLGFGLYVMLRHRWRAMAQHEAIFGGWQRWVMTLFTCHIWLRWYPRLLPDNMPSVPGMVLDGAQLVALACMCVWLVRTGKGAIRVF